MAVWAWGATMTQTCRACKVSATSRTRRSIGLPARGCSTLGNDELMRVPSPAARTTTVRGVVGGTICIASVVGEKRVVARLGFEPRQTDSKSVVLPLHNLATQKHYSTNHLPDAKKCGDEFLGRVFIISHSGRGGRGSNRHFQRYFTLPTSRFLLCIASFHAGCWHPERGISVVCQQMNVCQCKMRFISRGDAEGAEVTPPCDSPTYRILHGSPVETVPSGQVVLIHCVL